jgi:hypothetical protein
MKPILVVALLHAGCAYYTVDAAQAEAVRKLPLSQRIHAVIPAERTDGTPVFVRAAPLKLLAKPDARGRAPARAIRPMTIAGIVLLSIGAAWAATGATLLSPAGKCPDNGNDACGALAGGMGLSTVIVGGFEMILGAGLLGRGITSVEVARF